MRRPHICPGDEKSRKYRVQIPPVFRFELITPLYQEVLAPTARQRRFQRKPRFTLVDMRANIQGVALLRDFNTIDVETEFF